MADVRSLEVVDSVGAPVTTGVTAVAFDRSGGSRSVTLSHIGAGTWAFAPTDADETIGTVVLVDAGAGNFGPDGGRRTVFPVHLNDNSNQFWAVVVENPNGTVWAGAAPTVTPYTDSTGASRTAPTPGAVAGAYLWHVTPTAGDVAVGVEGRINGPAGSSVQFWHLSSLPVVGPIAALSDNPARALASYLAAGSPFALETPPGGTQALTFAAGGNLTAGPMRAAEGFVGEFHVSCLNSGGPLTPYMGSGGSLYEGSVTVRVRSKIEAYSQGEAVARAVLRRCQKATLSGYVSCLVRDAEPVYGGLDENGHHGFAFTVDVAIKR